MNTTYVVLRHPNRYRRVMHRVQPGETVAEAIRAATTHFDLKIPVVMVDPFDRTTLANNQRCPVGEYDLVYE
jgi:hypothetical protein